MKLILVRHGETEFNINRKMQGGSVDSDLTEKGRVQVEKLGEALVSEGVDVVYCSDLGRCRQTVEPFLKKTGLVANYDAGLREREWGVFDGGDCDVWLDFLKDGGYVGDFGFRPESGESFYDVQRRITSKISDIVDKEKGNILVVSHGSALISFLLGQFEDVASLELYEKYRIGNASVSVIGFGEDGKMVLERHNCCEHLNG